MNERDADVIAGLSCIELSILSRPCPAIYDVWVEACLDVWGRKLERIMKGEEEP